MPTGSGTLCGESSGPTAHSKVLAEEVAYAGTHNMGVAVIQLARTAGHTPLTKRAADHDISCPGRLSYERHQDAPAVVVNPNASRAMDGLPQVTKWFTERARALVM